MTSAAIFLHCYHHQESPAAFLLDLGECAALGCPKAPQISNFSQLSDRCCPTAMADFHIHCANAYSALASGKPLCTGVTYNDELLPQIKQCARCLSRDRLFAMCDVNNDLIFFCN